MNANILAERCVLLQQSFFFSMLTNDYYCALLIKKEKEMEKGMKTLPISFTCKFTPVARDTGCVLVLVRKDTRAGGKDVDTVLVHGKIGSVLRTEQLSNVQFESISEKSSPKLYPLRESPWIHLGVGDGFEIQQR